MELKGIESYYGHAALLLSSSTYELARIRNREENKQEESSDMRRINQEGVPTPRTATKAPQASQQSHDRKTSACPTKVIRNPVTEDIRIGSQAQQEEEKNAAEVSAIRGRYQRVRSGKWTKMSTIEQSYIHPGAPEYEECEHAA